MKQDTPNHDHTILLFVLALFVFHSPLSNWWTSLNLPWYVIFIFWGVLIALIAINRHRSDRTREH